jgi:anaerobic selenocysteine-containing dehydrogenase/Fe-S-cluster-containing dehydrogenase component
MAMKLTRRNFLGSAAGVLGGGLLAGCRQKLPRYLVPHAVPPDDAVPGIARIYRTVCRECPAACGVSARVCDGRAVKLEGSPDDPIGRGALCPRGQAAIEGLYAPARLGAPREGSREIGWDAAEAALAAGLKRALDAGQKVVVLTRPERGQLGALFGAWLVALGQPASQVVTFAPMDRPWLREGRKRAFDSEATPVDDIGAARLLLSIGDDLVEEGSPVEQARALANQRAAGGRFVYVGPRLSLTAASADRWISVEPGTEMAFVLGLARQVLDLAGSQAALAPGLVEPLRGRLSPYDPAAVAARTGVKAEALVELAASLARERPSLCVGPGRAVAGADAASLAEAVCVLNALLGNVGRTLRFLPGPPAQAAMDLAELAQRAAAGEVGALVVHHADPLGYGPVFGDLARAMARVPFVVAFANELDATARVAHLVLADHHFLESWSDVPSRPGVVAIQQPAMAPVLGTRAAADELLAAARALGKTEGLPGDAFADVVRHAHGEKDIERGGRQEEVPAVPVALASTVLAGLPGSAAQRGAGGDLALVVAPSFRHLDGLPARSALLQELPDPLSGFSWTGWVELHPSTAAALKVKAGDVVALESASGRVELPAHVTEAIRAGVAGVPVGDALPLLGGKGHIGLGVRVSARRTGARVERHLPEDGRRQHGRKLARSVSRSSPTLPEREPLPSMYPRIQHPDHRWALAIDLDRCNGCGACTAACYVENNLALVGPEDAARGRSMSWLRIQSFVEARPEGTAVSFLPVGCQHCTSAPCESVCPTFATYHTKEGLNAQVYSRCIGTRYCENNCPYGVRRFNFFDWPRTAAASLGLNPDVTVRERGVTEKCSLCVQRIRTGEEEAKVQGRRLRDGDVVSACAESCPTRAIVFGDLKDPLSEVSRLAADGRAYKLLEELNTDPGVFYLARRRESLT